MMAVGTFISYRFLAISPMIMGKNGGIEYRLTIFVLSNKAYMLVLLKALLPLIETDHWCFHA
jgi:hypothetical protein